MFIVYVERGFTSKGPLMYFAETMHTLERWHYWSCCDSGTC